MKSRSLRWLYPFYHLPSVLPPVPSTTPASAKVCHLGRNGNNLIFVSMTRLPPGLLVSGGGLSASLPASHLCSSPQAPSNRPASFKILILPPLTLAVFSSLVQNIDFEAIRVAGVGRLSAGAKMPSTLLSQAYLLICNKKTSHLIANSYIGIHTF